MAQAFGVPKQFDEGRFDPGDYIGKAAMLTLDSKDDGNGDRNTIRSWNPMPDGKSVPKAPPAPNPAHGEVADSDIPF